MTYASRHLIHVLLVTVTRNAQFALLLMTTYTDCLHAPCKIHLLEVDYNIIPLVLNQAGQSSVTRVKRGRGCESTSQPSSASHH